MNKRNLKLDEYGISPKRYKELCGFCEQLPDWQNFLKYNRNTMKSPQITDMPLPPHGNSDKTADAAMKCLEYSKKIKLIEDAAKEAAPDLWEYIIKSVCYEVPISYLKAYDEMPIEKSAFYERRRYFFYLLDKYKKD